MISSRPLSAGVDVSSVAAQVASWAWPIVLICITALFQFLRNLADSRHKEELVKAAASTQENYTMWSWVASLIGGPVITGLINAYKAKLDASNTQERIAAKEIE